MRVYFPACARRILTIGTAAFAVLGTLATAAHTIRANAAPLPAIELRVVTYDGNLFIAGSGDTCADAWQGAAIPADWLELSCVRADPIAAIIRTAELGSRSQSSHNVR